MSTPDSRSRRRSVVPRWRSLLNTPSVELATSNRYPGFPAVTSAQFNDLFNLWRKSGKTEDFADIMDAGIASGSRYLAVFGAKRLVERGALLRDEVRFRAESILFGRKESPAPFSLLSDESREQITAKIARLKVSVRESPRNALAHIELARLYCRLAQFRPAEHHITIALQLYPEDRFILRSATRFFTMVGGSVEALRFLRGTRRIEYDPWLQSAELAAAQIAGQSARKAGKAAKKALNQKFVQPMQSELVAGWITKMSEEGLGPKQTIRLIERALWSPTENALAQSVWLVDSMEGDFSSRFPKVHPPSEAHEAKAILLTESGDYREARTEAIQWFADQPFQARSSIHLTHLNFVHLFEYGDALSSAEAGIEIHPSDWMLRNLAILSSVYAGDLDRARLHLNAFQKLAEGDEQRAYLHAAQGMIAFEHGNLLVGTDEYEKCITLCKRAKRYSLILNAAIYMIESATRNGFIPAQDFEELEKNIEKTILSLPPAERREYDRTWTSRRRVMQAYLDQYRLVGTREESLQPALVRNSLQDVTRKG